jgi:hypothetical protein
MVYDFYYEARNAIRALNEADADNDYLRSVNSQLVVDYNELVDRFNHNLRLIRELEGDVARRAANMDEVLGKFREVVDHNEKLRKIILDLAGDKAALTKALAQQRQEAAASAARIKELEDALGRERKRANENERNWKYASTVVKFADAVIAGHEAQVEQYRDFHPESPLTRPSGTFDVEGKPRTFIQEVFDEAYSLKFTRNGGPTEDLKWLADNDQKVYPLYPVVEPESKDDATGGSAPDP